MELNQATEDVIQFLTDPEIHFGDSPTDVEFLEDPQMLREAVEKLLENPASYPGNREQRASLRGRLGEADWPLIAREFSQRVKTTARFFDVDIETNNAAQ